jgi:hypothetical protein
VSPNFEIAKNNMAIALTDLGTKVGFPSLMLSLIIAVNSHLQSLSLDSVCFTYCQLC